MLEDCPNSGSLRALKLLGSGMSKDCATTIFRVASSGLESSKISRSVVNGATSKTPSGIEGSQPTDKPSTAAISSRVAGLFERAKEGRGKEEMVALSRLLRNYLLSSGTLAFFEGSSIGSLPLSALCLAPETSEISTGAIVSGR